MRQERIPISTVPQVELVAVSAPTDAMSTRQHSMVRKAHILVARLLWLRADAAVGNVGGRIKGALLKGK